MRSIAARLALPAVLALGAANFLWQLGSSSYFVDEVQSVEVALRPLYGILHGVSTIEIAPPAYFYSLHEWLVGLGTPRAEWVARLPSAVCGVLLVAVVYWLASLLGQRRALALIAAALTACSPFVLEHAQRAQPYVFVSLATTVAVASAIEADRARQRRGAWLGAALVASLLAVSLHYTAVLVIAPLCVWLATRDGVPVRWWVGFGSACALVGAALIPLLVAQHNAFPHRPGTLGAQVSSDTVQGMLEVPFSGRVEPLRPLGIAVVVLALVALAATRRLAPARRLVVLVAVGEPLTLFILSVFGGNAFWGHLMITRYAAVVVPLLIVTISLALEVLPVPVAVLLAAGAFTVSIAGSLDSHRPSGFYLDARGAVRYLQARVGPRDVVLQPRDPVAILPLGYYGIGRLRPLWLGDQGTRRVVASRRRRLWVISELLVHNPPGGRVLSAIERYFYGKIGYGVLSVRVFPGVPPLAVVHVTPGPAS